MWQAAFGLLLACGLAAAGEVTDWREAAGCVGPRTCALRGRVVAQVDDGPVYRLYFDAARRDVYVTLIRGWMVTWPDYTGREIVATGRVHRFRDDVEMIVRTPDAIAFLDAPPTVAETMAAPPDTPTAFPATPTARGEAPTEPMPAPSPPAVDTPVPNADSEVERLRERVRTLERRLEEYEQRGAPQEE